MLLAMAICLTPLAGGGAEASQASASAKNDPGAPGNAAERYARKWEDNFALKDFVPADALGQALHAYFKKLFAALEVAMRDDSRDISRIVGSARESLAGETGQMLETFVTAGYARSDAELYFDRLYPRLQGELARALLRESTTHLPSVKREDSTVSDGLITKSEVLFYEKKDLVGALKALEDALAFAPANVRLTLDTALLQQKFGQIGAARENFHLARTLYPKLVNIYIGRGDIRVSARDYYGAVEDLTTAISLQPDAVRAYTIRGEAKMGLEDYEGAIDDFALQIASGIRSGLEGVHYRRAQAHFILGNLELALNDAENAIRLAPEFMHAHRTLGVIYNRLGNYNASLRALNKALELKPDNTAAYSTRMWSHFELGHLKEARLDADRLMELDPSKAFSLKVRAVLHDLTDQAADAERDYLEAIKLAQQNRDTKTWYYANLQLDMMLRRLGRQDSRYLETVLDWRDDWPKRIALHLSGRVTAESLLRSAKQAQTRSERRNQECEANYYIGMALWTAGKHQAAVPYLRASALPQYAGNLEYNIARKVLKQLVAPAPDVPAKPMAN